MQLNLENMSNLSNKYSQKLPHSAKNLQQMQ